MRASSARATSSMALLARARRADRAQTHRHRRPARAALRRSRAASPPRCRPRSPPTRSCSTPRAPRPTTRSRNAREATRIAELGYRHLLEIARPGMSEDELAVELKWYMKSLGAEDNFLLLCAGPHNRAVQPSNGRKLQAGRHHPGRDHAELSRPARADLPHRRGRRRRPTSSRANTRWWCTRWTQGIAAAVPGVADGGRLPRHQHGAGGGGLRRILPSAAHPPARPRPRLRLGAAGRRGARQRRPCSSPTWCS